MKAAVTSDKSTRTIELKLEGMPDLDVTRNYAGARPRVIRPDKAIIHISSGETRSIGILGPVIKKSGQLSDNVRDSREFRVRAYIKRERLDLAPDWVRELFYQVPLGVTTFTWVSEEEVSA